MAVGELAAQKIAQHQPAAEDEQDRRDGRLGEPGDLGQDRRDIGEDREHAGIAEHRGEKPEQHRATRQHLQLVGETAALSGFLTILRDEERDHRQRRNADEGHGPERRAPAIGLAEPGAEGNAEDVGDRQTGEHDGDGRGLLVGGHEARRHNGADTEKGAMRERRQHAGCHQRRVIRRDGTGEITEGEDDHEREKHRLARPAACESGEQRRTDHDAERVAGNEQARRRDRDAEIGAHLKQQAHDDEFGDADAEGTGRQRIKSKRHGRRP